MENYINDGKGGASLQGTVCDRVIVTELSSDFSLPDYQPEIKRILRVQATVLPCDRYIGVGNAEFSGNVCYNILYVGADGALYGCEEQEEYRLTLPVELSSDFELNEGFVCDVETVPDMTVGRLSAPRKLAVKCRLRSRVRIWGMRRQDAIISGCDEATTERLCGVAECAKVMIGAGEPFLLGDEILCEAQTGDLRVICGEGQVFAIEAEAGSGVANCRGEVSLKLLTCRDGGDGVPTAIRRRIPFTQSIPVDGAEVNCDATVSGVCKDLKITVEEGRILCELAVCLKACAQRNESVGYIRDLYSTVSDCEVSHTVCRFPRALKCVNGNFSLGTALSLAEAGIPAGATLLDFSMTPVAENLEQEHGKYRLLGRARCQVILSLDGEVSAQELEIPFRYECDGAQGEVSDSTVNVSVIGCRARMDGERIGIDAELGVSLSTRGESKHKMLAQAKCGEPIGRAGACYTVCYPAREDTLWSVAKRYRRSVETVASINSLAGAPAADSPESLAGVRYLLV